MPCPISEFFKPKRKEENEDKSKEKSKENHTKDSWGACYAERFARSKALFLFAFAVFVAAVVAVDAFVIEPNYIVDVVKINYTAKNPGLKGFKIVQITDLHFKKGQNENIYLLAFEKIKEIKPNIIVVTGDLAEDSHSFAKVSNYIGELSKVAPVYIVFGNWDHWVGLDKQIVGNASGFSEGNRSRVFVLVNNNTYFDFQSNAAMAEGGFGDAANASSKEVAYSSGAVQKPSGGRVCIIGVDDPYTYLDDIQKAVSTPRPLEGCSVKILLAHSPQIIHKASGEFDIILSGHTHGGQVDFPIVGALYAPLPPEDMKYIYGSFFVNGSLMFVSKGLGTRLLPVRFLCHPEVVEITFN